MGHGVLERVEPILERYADARVLGRPRALHVASDQGCEETAGPGDHGGRKGHLDGERPHGVGLALLLVGHGEDTLVHPGLDEACGHDRRGAAHAARRVDPEHGLAHAPQSFGEKEFGHHDALEHVGGLADDNRVDVFPVEFGVGECALGGFANQSHLGDVDPLGVKICLTNSDYCRMFSHGSTLQNADKILLKTRTRGGVGDCS